MTMDRVIKIIAGTLNLISVVFTVWVSQWWLLPKKAIGQESRAFGVAPQWHAREQ